MADLQITTFTGSIIDTGSQIVVYHILSNVLVPSASILCKKIVLFVYSCDLRLLMIDIIIQSIKQYFHKYI